MSRFDASLTYMRLLDAYATCLAKMILIILVTITTTDGEEYCLPETFHAECPSGQLILMDKSEFGRMELGRCVTRNYGHIGCHANVINIIDFFCSGKTSCDVSVSDPKIVRTKPCPRDFASYLEATYHCVPVIEVGAGDRCASPGIYGAVETPETRAASVSGGHGYLALDSESRLINCFVSFDFPAGQRLRIIMYDFSHRKKSEEISDGPKSTLPCRLQQTTQYAVINEVSSGGATIVETVCTGNDRPDVVYTSLTNRVQLRFLPISTATRFVLKFEALGCPDPILTNENSYFVRSKDEIVVVCNASTRESFQPMICRDGKWIGQLFNCSSIMHVSQQSAFDSSNEDDLFMSLTSIGYSIILSIGVALVIIVYAALIIMCVLFMRRNFLRYEFPSKPQQQQTIGTELKATSTRLPPTNLEDRGRDETSHNDTFEVFVHSGQSHSEELIQIFSKKSLQDLLAREGHNFIIPNLRPSQEEPPTWTSFGIRTMAETDNEGQNRESSLATSRYLNSNKDSQVQGHPSNPTSPQNICDAFGPRPHRQTCQL